MRFDRLLRVLCVALSLICGLSASLIAQRPAVPAEAAAVLAKAMPGMKMVGWYSELSKDGVAWDISSSEVESCMWSITAHYNLAPATVAAAPDAVVSQEGSLTIGFPVKFIRQLSSSSPSASATGSGFSMILQGSADIDMVAENKTLLRSGKVVANDRLPLVRGSAYSFASEQKELPVGLLDAIRQSTRGCGGIIVP